ncbi:MAG TPA: EpsI family protein [Terriglobales bacterium]
MMLALLAGATVGLRLVSHGEPVHPVNPLATFPLDFGTWSGRDIPIDRDVLKVAAVDDYLNRVYQSTGDAPVSLYVGYYMSQQTGDAIHSPKNCLPGSGWEPVSAGRSEIALPDGKHALVNSYLIEKGLDRELVLYWYQSHGRIIASEYWAKVYMVRDALKLNRTDSALVRVVTPLGRNSPQIAQARAIAFAEQALVPLNRLIPN